jgi:hypothetical protein
MARNVHDTIREVCLSFPEAEEIISHGSADFRVRGKSFASYRVNHHGDGRVALWLNAPAGSQDYYIKSEPRFFFVPPYVGPRGWLGVHLNKGLPWTRVASLVRQAYAKVAPRSLADSVGETVKIKSQPTPLAPHEVDPLKSRRAEEVLSRLRRLYLSWPEVSEDVQFGSPVWRAGKKTFAWVRVDRNLAASAGGRKRPRKDAGPRLQLYFWVGIAVQGLMTMDERFHVPAYIGHKGWIALDVTATRDWQEIRGLALASYRHFALQRMLQALDGQEAD